MATANIVCSSIRADLHADEIAHEVNGLACSLVGCFKALAQPVQGALAQVGMHPLCVLLPPEQAGAYH